MNNVLNTKRFNFFFTCRRVEQMDRGEIGCELLRVAWSKCEMLLVEKKIFEPWSLDHFYEVMRNYKEHVYTSEYTYRYIVMEVLIKSVNQIVYGDDQGDGCRYMQFFSVIADLNKKLTDKRQRASYVNEVVKYIEVVKGLGAKERYGLEICDNFSNSVMFEYSEHFGDYVENCGKADWPVWMMIERKGQGRLDEMPTMNLGKRDRQEASESKTELGMYQSR